MTKVAALLLALALTLLGVAQAAPEPCCLDCDNAALCAMPGCVHCVSPSLPTRWTPPTPQPTDVRLAAWPVPPARLEHAEIWKPPRPDAPPSPV